MPLRNSNDTEESYIRPRPIYRGQHPLVPTDVEQVFDISQEQAARYEDPHCGWPQSNDIDDGTDGPYHQRYPLIDRNIVDQFPAPPSPPVKTLRPGVGIPKRPPRPPTIDLADYQFDETNLLPEMTPALKAKMDAIYAENRRVEDEANAKARAEREAVRALNGHGIQRSASSASGYAHVRPLNIHRHRDRGIDPAHGVSNSTSTPQPGASLYANPAASNSTRSLDPRARYRGCLASSRQATANHNPSHSGTGIYSNSASSHSTQSLNPNARYRAALASTEAHGATPIDTSPATVRRRNASSASSRSALSARRHGVAAASEHLAHQALGPYHPDVMRVVRGPHGSKLQCPSPVRLARDMGLEVNDVDRKEWGVSASKTASGAATVAGYGRHGGHASRR